MPIEIVPFHTELISDAGLLLAQRHQRDRAVLAQLPVRFEDPDIARSAVTTIWERPQSSGVAALSNNRLLGYLIGEMVIDEQWGRSAWMRLPGCALAPDQNVELVRDLYSALAQRWVEFGCFTHFSLVPATDRTFLDMWFALSFGIEQVHALAELTELNLSESVVRSELEIRQAGKADRDTLADMSDIIGRHLTQVPVWGISLPEREAERRASYAEMLDDPAATVWLAFDQGQAVGFQAYFRAEESADTLLVPEACIELCAAGTQVSARGKGIGQILTQHGLADARAQGYRYCLTDWRSTNLLASRFFPRQGFRPIAYRLARRIDPRIAWANSWTSGPN